jgi:glycosyltransferase involved in cell wall biosynthesis
VLISLLVPVRNEQTYIGAMIDSVRRQSYPDFELVFADDGSTDATADIIRSHMADDPRIALVGDGARTGKVVATNRAFARSRGDLISVLGADDTLPPDSLQIRAAAFCGAHDPSTATVAFFRLVTMSEAKRFDGMVIPRADTGNPSGGTTVLSRALADLVFPIDERLVAEDVWIATSARALADRVVTSPSVVLNYRIHSGNSNPRHKGFTEMSRALHDRLLARELVLGTARFGITGTDLGPVVAAERLRYEGRTIALLRLPGLGLVERVYFVVNSNRTLYWLRSRCYRMFSGWQ